MLTVVIFATLVGLGLYLRSMVREKEPRSEMTDEQIKQKWRELGFFCELDDQKKMWTLTGSRAGLLYFPDLVLGYVNDPANATDGNHKHYGPYGSLDIMTWPEAGFGGNAIRGSLTDLARLAELVETKLASAQPGEQVRIREEFAADSPYSLLLDVRPDGFDPASADRERLGATTSRAPASQNQAPNQDRG
ncbi:MAG: hypothetical protein M3P12_09920 [Gemmatimonadota bacterium]|nr:hypothetical protein [Gemmatimonadota bacterium]